MVYENIILEYEATFFIKQAMFIVHKEEKITNKKKFEKKNSFFSSVFQCLDDVTLTGEDTVDL